MRYAVFGDIHGNWHALQAVLADIEKQKPDRLICLGDIVGYGADPVRCIDRILELKCDCIAGNHDWAAIERISIDFFNAYAKEAAMWTRSQISVEHKTYLANLPLALTYDEFSVAHGTFHQPEGFNYIQTVFDAQLSFEALRNRGSRLGFLGHSHVPVTFFDTNPITYTLDPAIPIEEEHPMMVNVGSVGQPRDENPRASYAMVDTTVGFVNIVRIDYDIDAAAARIHEAGLPDILAQRLYHGK